MSCKIGIPRALLYYNFFPLWESFFKNLGAELIVSNPTNKTVVDEGLKHVVDETCLPVKVFFGHIVQLVERNVDYLFVPRLVSVQKWEYICPKVMGLPDILKATHIQLPPLIKPTLNLVGKPNLDDFLWEMGSPITNDRTQIKRAWHEALKADKIYRERVLTGKYPPEICKEELGGEEKNIQILVLGHNYNIFDSYINMGLIEKLKKANCRIITTDQFPVETQEKEIKVLPKRMFWTYGKNLLGSTYSFGSYPGKKGVILVTSFGCGIDSIIGNMVIRYLNKNKIPYLLITLDEHTGEAGLNTRVEAFLDMLRWKDDYNNENYISSYGNSVGINQGHAGIYGVNCDCAATHY